MSEPAAGKNLLQVLTASNLHQLTVSVKVTGPSVEVEAVMVTVPKFDPVV